LFYSLCCSADRSGQIAVDRHRRFSYIFIPFIQLLRKQQGAFMANHASAAKRDRQSKVRRLRNRMNKSRMHTAIRHVEDAVAAGATEAAQEALQKAAPIIQRTASKGTIHKNTAARKISRLTKRVNLMTAAA
jgi:small subunit ribosomal protein S20